MALGNVFNEPRRELTESGVGIAVSVVPLAIWWFSAAYFAAATYNPNHIGENGKLEVAPYFCWVCLWLVLVFVAVLVAWAVSALFLVITHQIGESICDALQRRGIHLRPLQRSGRRC